MALGAWDRTAALASLLAEPHRDHESHPAPYLPNDFHPMRAVEAASIAATVAVPYDPKVLEKIHAGRQTR